MKYLSTFLFLLFAIISSAQTFKVSAEFRPRYEYRHGYGTLFQGGQEAASFVSQRSRLNFSYESDRFDTYISLQNVRVWGDVNTISNFDRNGTTFHEAWAKLKFNEDVSMKFGRQEIFYDDKRIFGNVAWLQQARSHDALVVTIQPKDNHKLDFGFALNEISQSLFQTDYLLNNYKSFQYLWYHTDLNKVGFSFLFMNQGLAFESAQGNQEIAYNQTLGSRLTFSKNKLDANFSIYYQTGHVTNRPLRAYDLAGHVFYKIVPNIKIGLGVEYISGTDMNSSDNILRSFTPWFGTNHAFNGFMDYFFVGNHVNSVGLLDIQPAIKYEHKKFSAALLPHFFSSGARLVNSLGDQADDFLGTEIDLVFAYKWTKEVNFQMGFSQMFASESMEIIKGGNSEGSNNWFWTMITVKPELFNSKN